MQDSGDNNMLMVIVTLTATGYFIVPGSDLLPGSVSEILSHYLILYCTFKLGVDYVFVKGLL